MNYIRPYQDSWPLSSQCGIMGIRTLMLVSFTHETVLARSEGIPCHSIREDRSRSGSTGPVTQGIQSQLASAQSYLKFCLEKGTTAVIEVKGGAETTCISAQELTFILGHHNFCLNNYRTLVTENAIWGSLHSHFLKYLPEIRAWLSPPIPGNPSPSRAFLLCSFLRFAYSFTLFVSASVIQDVVSKIFLASFLNFSKQVSFISTPKFTTSIL